MIPSAGLLLDLKEERGSEILEKAASKIDGIAGLSIRFLTLAA